MRVAPRNRSRSAAADTLYTATDVFADARMRTIRTFRPLLALTLMALLAACGNKGDLVRAPKPAPAPADAPAH